MDLTKQPPGPPIIFAHFDMNSMSIAQVRDAEIELSD